VRAACAVALGRLRAEEAAEDLTRLLSDRDVRVRSAACLALGSIRYAGAVGALLKCLRQTDVNVRSSAAKALAAIRAAEAVQPLIEALGRERSRAKGDIIRALTLITGRPYDDNAAIWRTWLRQCDAPVTVAPLAEAAEAFRSLQQRNVEYYGIRTYSTRLAFLVDVSGSMGGDKLEEAKDQLRGAIKSFTRDHYFNMIFFESGVRPWQRRLVPATDAVRMQAVSCIEDLSASGGTNIHDALMMALKDPDVDTVFLLSDGSPTAGLVTDGDGIRAAVRGANAAMRVVIHAIGIGSHDREFMRLLAEENGGRYVTPEETVKWR
jgi:uncharacterized protein YegL